MSTAEAITLAVFIISFYTLCGWVVWVDHLKEPRKPAAPPTWTANTITFSDTKATPEQIAALRKTLADHKREQGRNARSA